MNRLTRDGTAEPVSREQILRRERGQGKIHFLCSADHVQDWQPYPVDPYACYICDHTIDSILYNDILLRPCAAKGCDVIGLQETKRDGACSSICRRPDSHTCFFLFSFCLFGDVAFSEYFLYHCRFLIVWRVRLTFFPSGWCFSTL